MSRNFLFSYTSLALATMLMIAPIIAGKNDKNNNLFSSLVVLKIVGVAILTTAFVTICVCYSKNNQNDNKAKMKSTIEKIQNSKTKIKNNSIYDLKQQPRTIE